MSKGVKDNPGFLMGVLERKVDGQVLGRGKLEGLKSRQVCFKEQEGQAHFLWNK